MQRVSKPRSDKRGHWRWEVESI